MSRQKTYPTVLPWTTAEAMAVGEAEEVAIEEEGGPEAMVPMIEVGQATEEDRETGVMVVDKGVEEMAAAMAAEAACTNKKVLGLSRG